MDRVFLIVLDSFGIGAEPDCEMFGDAETVNTLKSVSGSDALDVPNMTALGLYNIDETGERKAAENPKGSFARMREASMAKDTTVGHWEISGLDISQAYADISGRIPRRSHRGVFQTYGPRSYM